MQLSRKATWAGESAVKSTGWPSLPEYLDWIPSAHTVAVLGYTTHSTGLRGHRIWSTDVSGAKM